MTQVVLIVDDSMVSRLMVKEIVKSVLPQATIIEASNGAQCLELINGYDQIAFGLFDYNMPEMNGIELIQALDGKTSIAHKALLTANIQDEIKQATEALGVTFLNKPITEELISGFLTA